MFRKGSAKGQTRKKIKPAEPTVPTKLLCWFFVALKEKISYPPLTLYSVQVEITGEEKEHREKEEVCNEQLKASNDVE